MARQNQGSDSGAAAFAALQQELQAAKAGGQILTVPEVVRTLKRRGFTKDAVGRALVMFEQYAGGRFEGDERARRDVRRNVKVVPPGLRA